MNTSRVGITLTVINLLLLLSIMGGQELFANGQQDAALLRGRGLEIVDAQGRVRASITVEPSVVVDGRTYPEAVLLRLSDPRRGPVVKLTASGEGSALGLSDDQDGGVTLMARGTSGSFVKVVDAAGREQLLRP